MDGFKKIKDPRPNKYEDETVEQEQLRYIINIDTWTKEQTIELRKYGFALINQKWQREEKLNDSEIEELNSKGYEFLER